MRSRATNGPVIRLHWLLMVSVLAGAGLAGCVADPAPSHTSPSLIEAHRLAFDEVRAEDRTALLVGFVANDRLAEIPAPGWLVEHAEAVPPAGSSLGEGVSDAWVLLYATSDGRVVRAVVEENGHVESKWVVRDPDPVAQALWGMNLGGRLLIDSPQAMEAARSADPQLDAHARENPDAPVSIASTIAPVGDAVMDLVYAVFWGPATPEEPFSRFAYVHHFTGSVVLSGDAASYREAKRVVLVDEEFTLGPVPMEASQEETLDFTVEDAVFSLTASGTGHYTVRLLHENGGEVVMVDGVALVQPQEHVEELGALEPGSWVLEVEVAGSVEFHLRIEGVVPVRPGGHPDSISDSG